MPRPDDQLELLLGASDASPAAAKREGWAHDARQAEARQRLSCLPKSKLKIHPTGANRTRGHSPLIIDPPGCDRAFGHLQARA